MRCKDSLYLDLPVCMLCVNIRLGSFVVQLNNVLQGTGDF